MIHTHSPLAESHPFLGMLLIVGLIVLVVGLSGVVAFVSAKRG
jgi:hypothetical protein